MFLPSGYWGDKVPRVQCSPLPSFQDSIDGAVFHFPYTRASQMKTLNILYLVIYWTVYGAAEHHGRYDVLIHDSYPDVWLFHSLLCGDFPSRWLNCCNGLWCHYMVCLTRSRRVCYRTNAIYELLVHSCTCCSDSHASPYWHSIRWWILMGFTPSLLKKLITECCSSLVHVGSGAARFTLLLRHHVAFLHRTATCRPFFRPSVSLLSTYNRAVVWIVIALLRFSFVSPSYMIMASY